MVDYDPYSHEVMSDPWPHYTQLRDEAPAHYLERYDCWVFSRFEDIWNATTQTEIYTAYRGVTPEDVLLKKEPEHHSFLTMDVPRHRAYRGLLSPSYTRRAIAGLEGRIREILSLIHI